jgi:hypothetical protein
MNIEKITNAEELIAVQIEVERLNNLIMQYDRETYGNFLNSCKKIWVPQEAFRGRFSSYTIGNKGYRGIRTGRGGTIKNPLLIVEQWKTGKNTQGTHIVCFEKYTKNYMQFYFKDEELAKYMVDKN